MTGLFKEFQEFRKILCVCPCCGDIVRVSDLRLKSKGRVSRTWLDNYENLSLSLDKKEERFAEREEKLREMAREKGRKEAERVFNKAISPTFKAFKLNPFDVKPILNPVDFVAFKGMTKKNSVSDILFLSKKCKNSALNCIRRDVKTSILKKRYEWQVARIDERGSISFE